MTVIIILMSVKQFSHFAV